jgi:outer membrane immunogenic protein
MREQRGASGAFLPGGHNSPLRLMLDDPHDEKQIKVARMRVIVVVWLAVLAFAEAAVAADLGPYLRGPQYEEPALPYRWSGVYGGGQVGFSVAGVDFSGGVSSLVAHILRVTAIEQDQNISNWPLLGKRNPSGISFGGFVGYNWQWEDAVTGLELNYNRTSLSGLSSDSLERVFMDDAQAPPGHHFQYDVTVQGSGSARITDFGTFRLRGGWAAGPFLPYAFVAVAVGRADVARSATVSYTRTDFPDTGVTPLPPATFGPVTETDGRNGAFAYGAAAGLGIDTALMPNLFLRGEWEYVQFAPLKGDHIHISTVRTALGLKF